jgi:hypothetical protein
MLQRGNKLVRSYLKIFYGWAESGRTFSVVIYVKKSRIYAENCCKLRQISGSRVELIKLFGYKFTFPSLKALSFHKAEK